MKRSRTCLEEDVQEEKVSVNDINAKFLQKRVKTFTTGLNLLKREFLLQDTSRKDVEQYQSLQIHHCTNDVIYFQSNCLLEGF